MPQVQFFLQNYLSIIANNTTKTNISNPQAIWDTIADEIARSLGRRGILTA